MTPQGAFLIGAALLAACPVGAFTYALGPVDSGPLDVSSQFDHGYTMFNFDDGHSPFTGGSVKSGSVMNQYVEPTGDTTPYFSVGPSTSSPASLALSGVDRLSFYWGSIDTYNRIAFNGLNQSVDGSMVGGTDSATYRPSREVTFQFTSSEAAALTGITLSSSTNAFEIDNLIFGAAPELDTWVMMAIGFGTVGAAMRRRRSFPRPTQSI